MAAPVTTYLPSPDAPRAAITVNDTEGDATSKTVTMQIYSTNGSSLLVHTVVIPNAKLAAAKTIGQNFIDRCRADVIAGSTPLQALVAERPQLVTDLAAIGVTV